MHSPVNKGKFINSMPPLGVLYMASFLESKGIRADVIDYNVSNTDYSVANNYDLLCFSVNCGNITNTLKMAEHVKKHYNKKILVGGPQVTSDPDFFLNKEYIDGAMIGEGEITFYEYIKKGELVSGMYLKDKNGKAVFGGTRPLIKDLDTLPFPALEKIDIKKYNIPIKKKRFTSSILTSRGCPFSCIFCFHPFGRSFRARSAKNVVDEIEWQVKKFGVKEICIQDDNVTLDINRAKDIFKGIIEKNLPVTFQLYGGVRVDRVDEELLELMKKANVWLMNVSPESGDPESINLMKKGFSKEAVREIVKKSKDLGFFIYSNFMVGFPWETEEQIKRTSNFALELDVDMAQFTRVVAFPNTELYDMCNLNYKIEGDIGLFYNDPKFNISKLGDDKISELIKEAYKKFYFRPKIIVNILKKLRWVDIYRLFRYSINTKSL